MTRVLQITTVPVTMRLFVIPLAEALAKSGYHVEVACGGSKEREFGPFPSYHVRLSRTPLHPTNGWALWELVYLMHAGRYDIVHMHSAIAAAVGRLAAHIAQIPVVIYTMHGSLWGMQQGWRTALFDMLERLLAPWTSHVFVPNDDDARDLMNRCHLSQPQITRLSVGGAGVALDTFDPSRFPPERVTELRQELELGESDTIIGYVGRLDRDKGIRELLHAVSRLRGDYPNLRLLLVGERLAGDRDALVNPLLSEMGAAVVCTGFRDDVPAMIACMDLVVSPSHRDGFGMVLAEAAAMGKAVVATATRGARAAVVDGTTGVLTPIGDVAALAQGIDRLLSDNAMRNQMGRAARRLALERFDRHKALSTYQAVYSRLLQMNSQGNHPRPDGDSR